MKFLNKNLLLIALVVVITVVPLFIVNDSEFGGADGKAEEAISEVSPNYEPWFTSFWEPPGGETESLLFALQAAIGSGFLGYYFGYKRGRAKVRDE